MSQQNTMECSDAERDAHRLVNTMRYVLAIGTLVLTLVMQCTTAPASGQVVLDSTSRSLKMVTSTSSAIDYVVAYADHTATAYTPATSHGSVASATTTTIVSAPSASTQRQVRWAYMVNRGSSSNSIVLEFDDGGTARRLTPTISLAPGDAVRVSGDGSYVVVDAQGRERASAGEWAGYGGVALAIGKTGTVGEAASVRYAHQKDSGWPGAWTPGSPGVNGANSNCSSASGASTLGAPLLSDPASGGWWLLRFIVSATVAHSYELHDWLWYNTGLSVTTTTAQSITTPTWPARDQAGGTNGYGLLAAIYVTTATTNGSAITNTTLQYTSADGVSGRNGTIPSFPATAVAGTFVPFRLDDGDLGIRSIQSITLGTSYGGGAISLVVYRPLALSPVPAANLSTFHLQPHVPGARLWNGTCLALSYIASATTATTSMAVVDIVER